jgi:excisionase family DNA binding protein
MTKKLTDINPLLLSIPQAAQKLGLSESCARQMAYNGKIPVIRLRRRLLVPVKQLEAWIDEQYTQQAGR